MTMTSSQTGKKPLWQCDPGLDHSIFKKPIPSQEAAFLFQKIERELTFRVERNYPKGLAAKLLNQKRSVVPSKTE